MEPIPLDLNLSAINARLLKNLESFTNKMGVSEYWNSSLMQRISQFGRVFSLVLEVKILSIKKVV